MDKPYTFAERLLDIMQKRALTRSELARICEVDKSNITRYLRGDYEAKQDVVYRIAARLGVSEPWLMGYDVPEDRAIIDDVELAETLTPDEQRLVLLYRRADEIDKGTIRNILSRYDEAGSSSLETAG